MSNTSTSGSFRRDLFVLALFCVIIVTAGAVRLYAWLSHFPATPQAVETNFSTMPINMNISDAMPTSEPQMAQVQLKKVSELAATGTVQINANYTTSTYRISANLPDITEAYEYGVWLVSNEDNVFVHLGRLTKDTGGVFYLEATPERSEVTFHEIMVTLEFSHTSSTPGKKILQGKLP